MKWLKCIIAAVIAPLVGSGLGLVIALLVMSFESQEASRSPGDGFLIGLCVFTGFAIGLMWAANYFNDSRNQDAGTDR
jgi:hypothetical protein